MAAVRGCFWPALSIIAAIRIAGPNWASHAITGSARSGIYGAGREAGSVLTWCLTAEARDELLGLAHTALGARWWPLLQAIVFADRDADLKMLAAGLALELVDSHDFPPPTSAHRGNRLAKPCTSSEG